MVDQNDTTEQQTPTSASAWRKGGASSPPIELPSGNFARLRNPGLQGFIKMGFIPNSLLGVIEKAIGSAKQGKDTTGVSDDEMMELLKDQERLNELFDLYDRVTVHCMADPAVQPVPEDEADRDDETLYVDYIDFEDKVFIFQFACGGTKDVESFRRQQEQNMGALR